MKISNKYVAALIVGGIATVLANVFSAIIYFILSTLGAVTPALSWGVGIVTSGGGMMLAAYIWHKIDKMPMKPAVAVLVALVGGVLNTALITLLPPVGIGFVIDFIIMYAAALLIVMLGVKGGAPGTPSDAASQSAGMGGMAKRIPSAQIANGEGLSAAILNAVRGSLKAPLSAVLCDREQMVIAEANGVYTVEGIVHSQNAYGAMIATDFRVTAVCGNGVWVITSCEVGKRASAAYAKSFVKNYIVISIFVGVMALLGTLFLFLIFDVF